MILGLTARRGSGDSTSAGISAQNSSNTYVRRTIASKKQTTALMARLDARASSFRDVSVGQNRERGLDQSRVVRSDSAAGQPERVFESGSRVVAARGHQRDHVPGRSVQSV